MACPSFESRFFVWLSGITTCGDFIIFYVVQVANGVVYDANKATALATVALVEKMGKE